MMLKSIFSINLKKKTTGEFAVSKKQNNGGIYAIQY